MFDTSVSSSLMFDTSVLTGEDFVTSVFQNKASVNHMFMWITVRFLVYVGFLRQVVS